MLIGIDANEANVLNRVGSNEFAFQILWQLFRLGRQRQFLIYLSSAPLADLPRPKANWHYRILRPGFFWTQWRLPLSLYFDQPRPDVFLTLGHYAPRFSPIPSLVCIMDLAFLKFPQAFRYRDLLQLKSWTKYSVKKAAHIFAISQATKKDLIAAYSVPERNVSVIYPGIDRLKAVGKSQIKGQYLLYVGTLQPRKNLDALIKAFSQIPIRSDLVGLPTRSDLEVKLVIAGKVGWKYEIKAVSGVKYLGYVPEEKLDALIKNSLGLVLPSLYEGFGIPVVQAMALGVPVLVSRNSSLPEIVGDCGLYIEPPFGHKEIKQGIIQLLSLPKAAKQSQLIAARQRSMNFSWEKSAQKILEVIHELTL